MNTFSDLSYYRNQFLKVAKTGKQLRTMQISSEYGKTFNLNITTEQFFDIIEIFGLTPQIEDNGDISINVIGVNYD